MNKVAATCVCGWLGLMLTACTSENRFVGNQLTREGRWYGEFGVVGHLNTVTVLEGSRLTTLKVVGDGNNVFVEDYVPVGKVEIWGANNEVSVPDVLFVRDSVWGHGSRVTVRALGARTPRSIVTTPDGVIDYGADGSMDAPVLVQPGFSPPASPQPAGPAPLNPPTQGDSQPPYEIYYPESESQINR